MSQTHKFNAFLSYSTDPDYPLVRRTEAFLEQFHTMLPREIRKSLPHLRICMDGSDFARSEASGQSDVAQQINALINRNLTDSEYLVVFCSRGAVSSKWIDQEINSFIEHRGSGDQILLVVTEGSNPSTTPEAVFPAAAIRAGLHLKPWYDFRGHALRRLAGRRFLYYLLGRRVYAFEKLREFEDAQVQLACHLLGQTAGALQPLWQREQQRRLRLARRLTITLATFFACLASALVLAVPQLKIAEAKKQLQSHEIAVVEEGSYFNRKFEIRNEGGKPLNIQDASPYLKTIVASGSVDVLDLHYAEVDTIEFLRNLKRAGTINLSRGRFSSLRPLETLEQIDALCLSDNPNLTDDAFKSLSQIQKIGTLDVSNCSQLSDSLFIHLEKAKIDNIDLSRCRQISKEGILHLLERPLKSLKLLDSNATIDEEITLQLEGMKSLQSLSISAESVPNPADVARLADRFGPHAVVTSGGL